MPPPVRSAERERRPNRCGQKRCGRRRRACIPIPPADGSAGEVRIFYCIQGGTAHNVLSDGSCARREKKKGRGVSPSLQVLEYLSKEAVLRPSRVPPIKKWDITGTDNYYTALNNLLKGGSQVRYWYKELCTLYKLCPSAMPSRRYSVS